jgi:hypothetical protein
MDGFHGNEFEGHSNSRSRWASAMIPFVEHGLRPAPRSKGAADKIAGVTSEL